MELFALWVLLVQQVGMITGVGAEAALVGTYAASLKNKDHEGHPALRGAAHAQVAALLLVVSSGVAALYLHLLGGAYEIIAEPAFVLKWILVGVVVASVVVERTRFAGPWLRGFGAAAWTALFLLHVVAPMAPWGVLLGATAAVVLIFMLCWAVVLSAVRPKVVTKEPAPAAVPAPAPAPTPAPVPPPLPPKPVSTPPPAPAPVPPPLPKPIPVPPPAPKPTPLPPLNLPIVAHAELPRPVPPPAPAPVVVPKPTPPPVVAVPEPMVGPNPDLPAIRVMPKTPEDIPNQFRGGTVELSAI